MPEVIAPIVMPPLLAGLPAGSLATDAHGLQWQPAEPAPAGSTTGVYCPLPDYGLLTVSGAEAAKFLHSQLTNDVEHLGPGIVRWNGYCTPKGRLLSVFLTWRDQDQVFLTISAPQASALTKRLSMYVMRSKAKVVDASADWAAFGLIGPDLAPALAALGITDVPAPMTVAWNDPSATGRIAAIGLPTLALDASETSGQSALQRVMVWADAAATPGLVPQLASHLQPAATARWRWSEIRGAVPRVFAATAEQFVPQMVNLELVDGVSFKKGCYPGQEVVARSQYLGKLKRRMFLGLVALSAQPGQDVLAADGQPCGTVVMSAPAPAIRQGEQPADAVLFESQLAALDQGPVRIGDQPVTLLPLPYEIPVSAKAG